MKAHEICAKAAELVAGDRERTHGDKLKNFAEVARLWNAQLKGRFYPMCELTARDVPILMVLMKIARINTGQHNPDNYVDIAGYAGCAGQVAEEQQ